jgi:glucosamine-6-phosphate deaminase
MKLIKVKDYKEISVKAAELILKQIHEKPNAVLGLATGSTMLGTYKELVSDFRKQRTSYKQVKTFNLDEYVGLPPSNRNSYHFYMKYHLFRHLDISIAATYIPNGMAADLEQECFQYEQCIQTVGGIDLQLLGIGINGHIGFNEPGTSFLSRTHVVQLDECTRKANARFFSSIEEVPTKAITMGITTIMESRRIILLVSGVKKATILSQLLESEIDEMLPASVLKNHPDVTILADEAACSKLSQSSRKVYVI